MNRRTLLIVAAALLVVAAVVLTTPGTAGGPAGSLAARARDALGGVTSALAAIPDAANGFPGVVAETAALVDDAWSLLDRGERALVAAASCGGFLLLLAGGPGGAPIALPRLGRPGLRVPVARGRLARDAVRCLDAARGARAAAGGTGSGRGFRSPGRLFRGAAPRRAAAARGTRVDAVA